MTAYTYVFKAGGIASAWANKSGAHAAGVGDELKNSVVFTWGFVEVICWFWVSGFSGEALEGVGLMRERRSTLL